MGEINSAYRFVPVRKDSIKFYSPEWKDKVSMDIPFKDNVSGEIRYKITTNTALFVKGSDDDFCNVEGRYFIPGTSVKGCLRSVLEILSNGHLDETRVKDKRFAYRDLLDQGGYMSRMRIVYCGWLDEDLKIHHWGKPKNISYKDLSIILNYDYNEFKKMDIFEKYKSFSSSLSKHFTDGERLLTARHFDKRLFCRISKDGNQGTIVFSGKIDLKKSDFVLLDKDCNVKTQLKVNERVFRDFKSLYPKYIDIPNNKEKGGRPVFFTLDEQGNVATIGLSYLHKYYAKNGIRAAIPENLKGGNMDLADVMFGSVKYKMRGRIQFCAAEMKEGEKLIKDDTSLLAVLGSPHASFYPAYLQSKTWDYDGGIIAGRKRYPIKPMYNVGPLTFKNKDDYKNKFGNLPDQIQSYKHQSDSSGLQDLIPKDDKDNINFDTVTQLKPIKENSVFNGKIHFFNLRKEELGALLAAITFNGHSECRHSLGQAKALGFGNVTISIEEININNEKQNDISNVQTEYIDIFSKLMEKECPGWNNSEELKELYAMAKGFSSDEVIDVLTPILLEKFRLVKRNYWKGQDVFSSYTSLIAREKNYNKTQEKNGVRSIALPRQLAKAKVTFIDKQLKKAALTEGKDQISKRLNINGHIVNLKEGDYIEVEVVNKGGNIIELKYIRKY